MKKLFYMGLLSVILSSSPVYASDTAGSTPSSDEINKNSDGISSLCDHPVALMTESKSYEILPSIDLTPRNRKGEYSVPYFNEAYLKKSKKSIFEEFPRVTQITLITAAAVGVLLTLHIFRGSGAR